MGSDGSAIMPSADEAEKAFRAYLASMGQEVPPGAADGGKEKKGGGGGPGLFSRLFQK